MYRLSQAGELTGLELSTPRNFKLTPYALGATDRDYATQDSADGRGDVGVDGIVAIGVPASTNVLEVPVGGPVAQIFLISFLGLAGVFWLGRLRA